MGIYFGYIGVMLEFWARRLGFRVYHRVQGLEFEAFPNPPAPSIHIPKAGSFACRPLGQVPQGLGFRAESYPASP